MNAIQINLAETPDFDLGGLRVSPAHRQVRFNGEQRELEPKVVQVLVALASARPDVVSRDRLIEQCWDGRIVGDDALNRCIVALRHLAKEFSPEPFSIETVPRVGYSLIEAPAADAAKVVPAGKPAWLRRNAAMVALLVLILIGSTLAFTWSQFARGSEPASIAVLPFRNLSTGDAFFAEGVGEEIMGQLAREPAFQVAGSASSAQFSGPSDPRKVGEALGVDYILEGSVRPGGDRVRINAALIRTKDGLRMWSETYDRGLDDILEIQAAIGQAVATGLKRELIHAAPGKVRPINGEAYALYLNARGLIRYASPQSGHDATVLLRQSIRLDPGFAPAWSGLARALQLDGTTKGSEGLIAVVPDARAAARQALRLDPKLAEAHAVFANLFEADSPAGIAHKRRASELDPRNNESLVLRGAAHEASGEWAEGLAAYLRAHETDPLWPLPLQAAIDLQARMGDRAASEALIRREFKEDLEVQNFALARVAYFSGDFSEAARRWSAAANGQSKWANPSKLSLENALFMLELSAKPPSRPKRPGIGQSRLTPAQVRMASPPTASEWKLRNRSSAAELVYRDENVVAAKLLLNAGRARELVATFDSPTGLLGLRAGEKVGTCFLQNAAIVALALRAVGRGAEADTILRGAAAAIQAAYRRGAVPLWLEEDAAGIWAVQGKYDQAAAALDRALRRGSSHSTRTDLPKLSDEPAFALLRGNRRYEAVRSKYDAHYARERAETAAALKISGS